MGQIKVTAAVEPVHQTLIALISTFVAEADEIQRHRRGQFEAVVILDPSGELLRQRDVLTDVMLQPLYPIMPDDEPQLERAETPSQRNLPVAIVDHGTGLGGFIAQVFGQHTQSLDEGLPVRDIEAIAVEIGEHPFVGIEAVAVGKFQSGVSMAKFRTKRGRA